MAQDEGNIKIPPPKPIIESEIKEVKLWGIYEDLPNMELLPTDLWLNSNFSNLNFAFAKLNNNDFIPIDKLLQRVIFSGGIAPNDDEKLAKERFYHAHNLGPLLEANKLISNFSNLLEEENLAIIYSENLFYEEKIEEACEIISQIKPKTPKRKLLELRATCFALHNEIDAARLSLEVASSLLPKPNDDWLVSAVQYVANIKEGNLPNIARNFEFNGQNGINFILSKAAKTEVKKGDNFSKNTLKILVANNETLPLNAAIMALRFGFYDYEKLASSVPFETIKANSNQKEETQKIDNIDSNIDSNIDIGENILFYLKKARNINEFINISKTIAPKLKEVKQLNIDNIQYFAAAAILTNQKQEAERFLNMDFAQKPAFELAYSLIADFPKEFAIMRRIDAAKPNNIEQINAYGDAIIAKEIIEKNTVLNNLLSLNFPNNSPNNNQILYSIENAAQKKAIAEVILLSSILTQKANIKTFDPFAMAKIIRALNDVNLQDEAKELAIYAIIGRNLDFVEPKIDIKSPPRPSNKPDWKPNVD